jgi:hypothetical protein
MSDLLLDLIDFLVDNNKVEGRAIDAFTDNAPISPDDIVSLYEYGGNPAFIGDFANRGITVQVRNKIYTVGKEKIHDIYNLFHKNDVEDRIIFLTEDRWAIIHPRSTPTKLKVDESNRTIFTFSMGVLTTKD